MSIVSVRYEIAQHLQGALDGVYVSEHGGAFSSADIERYAKKSPAVIIACLGVPSFEMQANTMTAAPIFAAFCLAAENSKERRDIAALLLAESVAVEIPRNRWNGSASGTPKTPTASNLYSTPLDKKGIALWAVRWTQQVDLQRNVIATIDDFKTMHGTYDAGQTDGTTPVEGITELEQ